MKVILMVDHKDLGKKGAVINVADGFARNFLLPRGIVQEADSNAMKTLQTEKGREQAKAKRLLTEAKQIAAGLKDKTVVVRAKAGDSGRLFGSVTSKDVADAIQAQYKLDVDKRRIDLDEQIKTIGLYSATLKLHHDIELSVNVKVESEGDL